MRNNAWKVRAFCAAVVGVCLAANTSVLAGDLSWDRKVAATDVIVNHTDIAVGSGAAPHTVHGDAHTGKNAQHFDELVLCDTGAGSPDVDGDLVVWYAPDHVFGSGNSIYGYDLSTGQKFRIGNEVDQKFPRVDGDTVVWYEPRFAGLKGENLATGETFEWQGARNGAISGDLVVGRGRKYTTQWDIYGYRISTGEEFVIADGTGFSDYPAISGDMVAYTTGDRHRSHIHGRDLATNEKVVIAEGWNYEQPTQVSGEGDTVAYRQWTANASDVFAYHPSTGETIHVVDDRSGQVMPDADGDLVVWMDYRLGDADIWGRYLSGGPEFPICTAPGDQLLPRVSGNTVVWYDARTIPSSIRAAVVPEPATMALLAVGGLAMLRRKRAAASMVMLMMGVALVLLPSAPASADLLVSTYGGTSIHRVSADGSTVSEFSSLSGRETRAMCWGPEGNLFVSTATGSWDLLEFDPATGKLLDAGHVVAVYGMVAGADGALYGSYRSGFFSDDLVRIDPDEKASEIFARTEPYASPWGMTLGADENLYVACRGSSKVIRVDPQTATITDFIPSISQPRNLVFGPDGHLYVTRHDNSSVERYHGQTGAFIDVFVDPQSGGLANPQGLIFPGDGYLYIANAGGVHRYDAVTGTFDSVFCGDPLLDSSKEILFIPEPATMALLAIGGLALIARRRKNAAAVVLLLAGVGVVFAPVGVASADTFVYRADPTEYRMGWGSMVVDREWGCEVELAGAERHVTELMLVADPPNGGTMDVAGRIYANDGQGGEPGSLLWDSGWRSVSFADGDPLPLTFEAPGVLVPDRITAVLAIENISNTSYGGMERTDNITVGTVHTRWSRLPGSDWVQGLEDGTSVQMHVLAIPEPATMALLAVGGLALVRRRRNRP